MNNAGKQRMLVAPLDWGLGHAARCAPLIDRWLSQGHEVILASNGRSATWLQQRYPRLEVLTDIPDYAVTYPTGNNMSLHFAKLLPRLVRVVREENQWLRRLVEARAIDCVYSDNRYGLYHDSIPCTLITHQLYVRLPGWSKFVVYGMLNGYFKRFQSIWIPDYSDGKTLSGALSHGGKWDQQVRYVGPLSRFAFDSAQAPAFDSAQAPAFDSAQAPAFDSEQTWVAERNRGQIVALISGPEPSRTTFEHQLRKLLKELNRPALLVLGKPDEKHNEHNGLLTCINHLPDAVLADALQHAQLVICRSGYSTLMDLEALNVRALLVPTPGQTEQEYLAEYHGNRGNHFSIEQQQLTLEVLLTHLEPRPH